jgi:NAD(P)-dependent dehydrogenase (short-subunit alcohol dehydrogenase family)
MEDGQHDTGLADRVAIVTGGGRGLGRAMALGLVRAGCRVVITAARESAELAAVEAEAGTDRLFGVKADVTDAEACEHVVETAYARFGPPDILVNNAGRGMKYVSARFFTEAPRVVDIPPDVFRMVIDTNVNGPFLMAHAALPAMLDAGWGRIINVSMNRETMRRVGFSPYGPSKAALESETIIWAQDLADTGVTVNAILPGGATETGMIPDGLPDGVRARLLRPEVMVPPLLWLASPRSDGVTGKRVVANRWREGDTAPGPGVIEDAGWVPPAS